MQPTRVLHVIPSIGPARGGPSVVIRTMARSQAAAGMQVDVATTDDDGAGRLQVMPNTSGAADEVTFRIFRRQTRFYTVSFPLATWLWKHSAEYDVIHIHAMFSYASVAAAFCAMRARVPYLIRPLGTLSHWSMRHGRWWVKSLSFRLIESRVMKNAAGVHYTSMQEEIETRELGVPHNSFVIPNPVDLPGRDDGDVFRRLHPELIGRTVVLFMSRLDPKKGLDILLPAFLRVKMQPPRAILVVAGDGEPAFVGDLRRQAECLGLKDEILWTGFLEGEAKRAALSGSDLFVLPSYSENFGVVVVEAMKAGLPVIVSDQVGIHQEITEAQAGLVVPCDVDRLASALIRAVNDPGLRVSMGAKAIELAKTFSPESVAATLAKTYDRIRRTTDEPTAA